MKEGKQCRCGNKVFGKIIILIWKIKQVPIDPVNLNKIIENTQKVAQVGFLHRLQKDKKEPNSDKNCPASKKK